MTEAAHKIMAIVDDHSGGIKYTELITEMAEWAILEKPLSLSKYIDLPDFVMNTIMQECNKLGVLEYSTASNRSKFFIYRKG